MIFAGLCVAVLLFYGTSEDAATIWPLVIYMVMAWFNIYRKAANSAWIFGYSIFLVFCYLAQQSFIDAIFFGFVAFAHKTALK